MTFFQQFNRFLTKKLNLQIKLEDWEGVWVIVVTTLSFYRNKMELPFFMSHYCCPLWTSFTHTHTHTQTYTHTHTISTILDAFADHCGTLRVDHGHPPGVWGARGPMSTGGHFPNSTRDRHCNKNLNWFSSISAFYIKWLFCELVRLNEF